MITREFLFETQRYHIRKVTIVCLLVTSMILILSWFYWKHSIFNPVKTITESLNNIAMGDLTTRVNLPGHAEFSHIAERISETAKSLDETKLKASFLAAMSHDVRTPLQGILGMAELLGETMLEVKQRHYLKSLDDAARTLYSTLTNILDFTRLEAGKIVPNLESIETSSFLDATLKLTYPQAIKKNLQVNLDLQSNFPQKFTSDPTRLQQIIVNLLNNAIKYTSEGSVTLVAVCDDRMHNLTFEVRDTGSGIKPEDVDNIFEPFRQGENSLKANLAGIGLGLSIAKKLTEVLNGKISVKPNTPNGMIFRVELKIQGSKKRVASDLNG